MIPYMVLLQMRRLHLASVKKIIEKMKSQPNGIRPDEADKVLTYYCYIQKRISGSHKQYVNNIGDVITIVQRKQLYEYEVKDILRRIGE